MKLFYLPVLIILLTMITITPISLHFAKNPYQKCLKLLHNVDSKDNLLISKPNVSNWTGKISVCLSPTSCLPDIIASIKNRNL